MGKSQGFIRWFGILGVIAVCMVLFRLNAVGQGGKNPGKPENARPDVIVIDTLRAFGNLETEEVVFFHDAHTKALEKQGKDCTACHLKKDSPGELPGTPGKGISGIDPLSSRFRRLEDRVRRDVMDTYHAHCIGCHKEMKAEDIRTGPVTCGACHRNKGYAISRIPMKMDHSLHSRHSGALDKKCENCHHRYNEKKEKLYYEKGKEGNCRHCHGEKARENRISMRLASHIQCITCHRGMLARKKEAGPVNCAGCHSKKAQDAIERVSPVPRIERNQPDYTLVRVEYEESAVKGKKDKEEKAKQMAGVPLNHKKHEKENQSCMVCHHKSMDGCSSCHTLKGDKKGEFVKLEQAMHLLNNQKSCIGCHQLQQKEKNCAGCHGFMPVDKPGQNQCANCHLGKGLPENPDKETRQTLAREILENRSPVKNTIAQEDIPEKVVISHMEDQYEKVEFPHRKIVNALVKNMENNTLAQYFHPDKLTVCMGCHHNTPASEKPPACLTCHGRPFDTGKPYQPGIKAAYHQQCMGCHERMKIEKPMGCTECHKEKK